MPSQMVWDVTMVLPTKAVTRHMGSMQLMMTPAHPTRQRMPANICIPMEAIMQRPREPNQPQQSTASVLRCSWSHHAPSAVTPNFFDSVLLPSSDFHRLHCCLHLCHFPLAMPATLGGVPGVSCFSCGSDSRCVSVRPRLVCLQPALPHFSPPPSVFPSQRRSVCSQWHICDCLGATGQV